MAALMKPERYLTVSLAKQKVKIIQQNLQEHLHVYYTAH